MVSRMLMDEHMQIRLQEADFLLPPSEHLQN